MLLYQALDLPFGQSRVQEGVRIFFVLRAVSDGIAEVRITHQIGDSKDIADALVFRRQMHWEFVCLRSNSTWLRGKMLRRFMIVSEDSERPGMLGRAVRRVMLASIFVAFSGTSAGAQASGQEGAQRDAVREIVAAFKQHPVVIIGEAHWLRQPGDFYVRLVGDPEFQETVQDIVIEFASRNNQPLLDRYSAGQNVPIEEVRRIWQDTTKVASWESPIYAEWLAAIREVNKTLPAARRLRVLAGDTAIDWSQIKTHDDWAALGDNNISIADVVIHEVLEKKHRALVVLGSNHVTRSGDRNGNDNTTTRIESRYPGSTYVVMMLHVGALNPALEDQLGLAQRNAPALYALAGTPQGKMRDQNGSTLIEKADALLYLGPRAGFTLAMPPAGSLEPAYLREIDRRSMIEWGELRARKFLGAAAQ